jgi:hypothetical protein
MLVAVVLVAGISLLAMAGLRDETGRMVVVKSLKGESLLLDLSRRRTVEVEGLLGSTTISIDEGTVRFIESPCPHRLCIKKGPISRVGDLIACLPNGVVARIEGKSDYDGITP